MVYNPSCEEEVAFLKNYNPNKYKNPAVAADTALFAADGDALKVLLIRRGGYPYKGSWALPGGFVNIDEDIRVSAQREANGRDRPFQISTSSRPSSGGCPAVTRAIASSR